jgi:zinc transport system ATP-binding protein
MEPVVELDNICFSYNGEPVLEDVSLRVPAGDFLAVFGPNGSGKTTLLKILLGLLQPGRGRARVLGTVPQRAASRIGYVPQHVHVAPDFPVTVEDVVLMGLVHARRRSWRYSRDDRSRARRALERVEMLDYRSRIVSQLSGGQLQRVIIARALVSDPELLLLDEPTSDIDPHGTFCFYEFLERLNRHMTIVIVSHDIHIIATRVKSIACVNRRLHHNNRPGLTPDMLALMYGEHNETCPAGIAIDDLSQRLGYPRGGGNA